MQHIIKAIQERKAQMEIEITLLQSKHREVKSQADDIERQYNQLVREKERIEEELALLIKQTR